MARNNFIDRVPNHPGRFEMTRADGTTEVVTLVRDDEASTEGTKLNAETLNQLAQLGDFSPNEFYIDPETFQITLKNSSAEGKTEYVDKAMIWRINNNLNDIVICNLDSASDIDISFFDGASVVENYYDAEKFEINKVDEETVSFCTPAFDFSGDITAVGYTVDGIGDISAFISFNDGASWTKLGTERTKMAVSDVTARLKFTLTGECYIKNFCWGVTVYE